MLIGSDSDLRTANEIVEYLLRKALLLRMK